MISSIDPIPSIDYSLGAIFSVQDRELDHISSSKRDEIVRIFKRLSTIRIPLSLMDFSNEPCQDSFASWYRNDEALMGSCKAGMCYDHGSIIQPVVNDEQHASNDH